MISQRYIYKDGVTHCQPFFLMCLSRQHSFTFSAVRSFAKDSFAPKVTAELFAWHVQNIDNGFPLES